MTRRTVLALLTVAAGSAMAAPWALAHPGHDHKVLGTVTTAAADRLVLKDRAGKDMTVRVIAATRVLKDKRRARIEDVKVGDRVVATVATENEQLVAKLLEVGTPSPTK